MNVSTFNASNCTDNFHYICKLYKGNSFFLGIISLYLKTKQNILNNITEEIKAAFQQPHS